MKPWKIIMLASTLIPLLCMPAASAEWGFYGSARVMTWSYSESAQASPTGNERTDTVWDLQGNSRIGATAEAGDIAGRFEYGTGVNLRRLYATWDFGKGVIHRYDRITVPFHMYTRLDMFF